MYKTGFLLLMLCVATLAFPQNGPDSSVLYSAADIVFTGRLHKLKSTSAESLAYFEDLQVIKGLNAKRLLVRLPLQSSCHRFEENHVYLVYSRKVDEELWADQCESKLKSEAEGDLRYIHTLNPKVSGECSHDRLQRLATRSPIITTVEVVGTEDSLLGPNPPLMRVWCGLTFTTEDVYYKVVDVKKGIIPDSQITVEHPICWDTVTIDGYYPKLSPVTFREGNILVLFLKPGSHQPGRRGPTDFAAVFEDVDENCGAISSDDEVALDVVQSLPTSPNMVESNRAAGAAPRK